MSAQKSSTAPVANAIPPQAYELADLIVDWETWVHRRVETVVILDENRVRRDVSVDFTLPEIPNGANEEQLRLVPVALLRKAPLRGFDISDERNTALPVLNTYDNAELARDALLALASYPGVPKVDSARIFELVKNPPPRNVQAAVEALIGSPATPGAVSWPESAFRTIATELASNFLLIVEMKVARGERRIIKYCYEGLMLESGIGLVRPKSRFWAALWLLWLKLLVGLRRWARRSRAARTRIRETVARALLAIVVTPVQLRVLRQWLGLDPVYLSLVTELPGLAQSYHLELESPEGLAFCGATLELAGGRQPPAPITDNEGVDRIHLHLPEHRNASGQRQSQRGLVGRLQFQMRPRAADVLRQAYLVSWAVSMVPAVGLLVHEWLGVHPRLDPAAALIVALPALFAVYLAAPAEHRLSQRLVFGIRDRIWLSAGLAFACGAVLTLDVSTAWRVIVWFLAMLVSTLNCWFYFLSLRASYADVRQRLGRPARAV